MPEKLLSGYSFKTECGEIKLPDVVIASGDYSAFPINLRVGDLTLKYATATPLYKLGGRDIVLFSRDGKCDYEKKGEGRVIVLSKDDALISHKVSVGGVDYLLLVDGEIYTVDGARYIEYKGDPVLKIYPKPESIDGYEHVGDDGDFAVFEPTSGESTSVGVKCSAPEMRDGYAEYRTALAYGDEKPYEAYLEFDFAANLLEVYSDGEKLNDMLYTGVPFELSLRYYGFPKEITVRLYPLSETKEVYLEKIPEYENGIAASLNGVDVTVTKKQILEIKNEI